MSNEKDNNKDGDVTIGVGRTSIFVAACRAIITNKYLELLQSNSDDGSISSSNKEIKENAKQLISIYQDLHENETFKVFNKLNICIFDPYALVFCIGEDGEKLLLDTFSSFQKDETIKAKFKEFIENAPILAAWSELLSKSTIIRMAFRTKYIDEFVLSNQDQYKQIVILGAGLDCRSLRLPLHDDCKVFEIDLPHVIEYKEKALETLVGKIPVLSKSSITRMKCDLCNNDETDPNSWLYQLKHNDQFNSDKPILWIMEGLVMYIENSQLEKIFKSIENISVSSSKLMVHTINKSIETSQNSPTLPEKSDNLGLKVMDWSFIKEEFVSRHNKPVEDILMKYNFSKDTSSLDYKDIVDTYNFNLPDYVKGGYTKFSIGTKI